MKSLNLSTPDVRIRRSKGGKLAVNMWSFMVSEVIVSGSGYVSLRNFLSSPTSSSSSSSSIASGYGGGESGCRVVEEDMESSVSEVAPDEGEWERTFRIALAAERRRARIVCVMWDSEKERGWEVSGAE